MKKSVPSGSKLKDALTAHQKNVLLEWTVSYLAGEKRNKGIADHIRERNILHAELVEYPLELLKRVEGPQNGEVETEPIDIWVKRVEEIQRALDKSFVPEPLIVTDFWDTLEIADGNHRHEALLKNGFKKYWTIFLLTKPDSHQKVFRALEHA